jgi:hypothetical protein
MTILLTIDIPVSRDVLEAVSAEMGVRENPPPGLVAHVMTETADGVHIVDIWDSREQFETFQDERLMGAMGKVMAAKGIPMPDAPSEPKITEAHDLVRGR